MVMTAALMMRLVSEQGEEREGDFVLKQSPNFVWFGHSGVKKLQCSHVEKKSLKGLCVFTINSRKLRWKKV